MYKIKSIQKKIIIIVSILSLLFSTLQPKKAEASAAGVMTLGALPTLTAFIAAVPAFAVAAVVGVAVFIAVGLTLDNWDEITAIGTAVVNDMAAKGIQVAEFVSGTTVTWSTELKESIQNVLQSPPTTIRTIPARNETHYNIQEQALTANHLNLVSNPGDMGKTFIGIRTGYSDIFHYYFDPDPRATFSSFNTSFGLSVRFPAIDITNGQLEFYPYFKHPSMSSRDEDTRTNPYFTYQIDYLYNGNSLVGFDMVASMEIPTEVSYPGSKTYYREVEFNQIRVNNYSTTETFAPRFQSEANPEAGKLIVGNNEVFLANNTLVPNYTSPFNSTIQKNINDSIFTNNLVVTYPGGVALDGKNIKALEEITDIALSDSQRETLEALPSFVIDTETPDSNDNADGETGTSGILGILGLILNALIGLPRSIIDGILSGFSWLQSLLNNIWNSILSIPGATAIATAIGNTFNWLQGLLASIRDSILSLPGLIASAIATSFNWLHSLLSNIWEGISSLPGLIGAAISSAFSWLQGLLTSIWEGIVSLPSLIGTAIGSTFSWLQNLLSNIWDGIISIPGAIGTTFSWLQGLLTNIWQTAIAIPGATYDVLVDVFNLVFTLDQDWLQSQLQILVAELALKIPAVPNVVEMIAYKGDKDEWAGLYANFDHYGIGKQKVVDNHAPNYFRHTTKIIIRGFLYFLLALFFIRKVYIFADD